MASSAAVYGTKDDFPLHERHAGTFHSPYADSKWQNEHQVLEAKQAGMEAVALRFFNVYGAGQRSDGAYAAVVPKFIELALAGQAATIFGDGLQTRDFVHVSDVANAVLMMATQPWDGERAHVYNVCTETECSLLDLMREIHMVLEEVAPHVARHAPNHGPERAGDIARSIGSNANDCSRHRVGAKGRICHRFAPTNSHHPPARVTTLNVLWLTGRSMNDLCSTTQQALIHGLLKRGMAVTFVNADSNVSLAGEGFTHVALPNQARRGFQARTLGKAMRDWLAATAPNASVAVVEWRVAAWVVPELERQGIPWTLMDRSPPADAGWLGRLQWRGWKAAWNTAVRAGADGFVVSTAHQAFVEQKTGYANSTVLQAGVDLELFKPKAKRPTTTMVYHGRLDRHRGVLACAMLAQKARLDGLEVDVVFVGEGDLVAPLTALAEANAFIHVHGTMPQSELAELLGTCHLGLLPMPKRTVWALASPLKRSEYLASGLPVFGIDHEGHRLDGVDDAWFSLVPQEDFHLDGLEVLRSLVQQPTSADGPRTYAQHRLAWTNTVDGWQAS